MTDFAIPENSHDSAPVAVILLADPDALRRDAYAATLRAAGFEVTAAEDDASALAAASQSIAAVVIRHLGSSTPGVPALCRQIRAAGRTRNLPVIVLTAFDDEHTREQIVRAGATAILTEPLKEDLLIKRVRQLVTHTGRRRRAS
jgi:DNA-binding response OmpR family regulator